MQQFMHHMTRTVKTFETVHRKQVTGYDNNAVPLLQRHLFSTVSLHRACQEKSGKLYLIFGHNFCKRRPIFRWMLAFQM